MFGVLESGCVTFIVDRAGSVISVMLQMVLVGSDCSPNPDTAEIMYNSSKPNID